MAEQQNGCKPSDCAGCAHADSCSSKPKDFKKNPDQYKGHVGDVSTVVRLAVTGRSQSPDIWEIQQILGEERTVERVKAYAAQF